MALTSTGVTSRVPAQPWSILLSISFMLMWKPLKDSYRFHPRTVKPRQSQLNSFSKYYLPKGKVNIQLVVFIKPINTFLHQFILQVIQKDIAVPKYLPSPLGHACRYSRAAINSSAFTSSELFLKPLSPLEFPLEWFWICLHSKLLKLLESKDLPVTINK